MHSSHLHVEKVTPLVLWIATPRKRCPGGWYLGAVHSFYTTPHTYMDPTCLRYGGLPGYLAVLAVDRCSSGFLITGPGTVRCPAPNARWPRQDQPAARGAKIRYGVLCLLSSPRPRLLGPAPLFILTVSSCARLPSP